MKTESSRQAFTNKQRNEPTLAFGAPFGPKYLMSIREYRSSILVTIPDHDDFFTLLTLILSPILIHHLSDHLMDLLVSVTNGHHMTLNSELLT